MAQQRNEDLNKAIVLLRKFDPEHYSFGVLSNIFRSEHSEDGTLSKSTVKEKWDNFKDDYELPEGIKPRSDLSTN